MSHVSLAPVGSAWDPTWRQSVLGPRSRLKSRSDSSPSSAGLDRWIDSVAADLESPGDSRQEYGPRSSECRGDLSHPYGHRTALESLSHPKGRLRTQAISDPRVLFSLYCPNIWTQYTPKGSGMPPVKSRILGWKSLVVRRRGAAETVARRRSSGGS